MKAKKLASFKTKKLVSLLSAIGFGLALASSPASAAIQFYAPVTNLEDDNLDFIVDSGAGNIGTIGTGDRIITVFEYNRTFGNILGQGPTNIAPEELTGVSDFTVGPALGGGVFALVPSGGAGVLSAFAAGTAVALWTDATPDLDVINANCGTRDQCLTLAGLTRPPLLPDGSVLWATAGFFGDPDVYALTSPGPGGVASIPQIEGGAAGTTFGFLNFGLQVGVNNTGQVFESQSCAPFCPGGGNTFIPNAVTGSGNLLGGVGLDHTQWTGRSDNDAQVTIPEPGSLALLGLAIVGLGVMRRRNRIAG